MCGIQVALRLLRCSSSLCPKNKQKRYLLLLSTFYARPVYCVNQTPGLGTSLSLHTSQVAHQAGAYPSFCSMKRLGIFLLHPGWEASPSEGVGTWLFLIYAPCVNRSWFCPSYMPLRCASTLTVYSTTVFSGNYSWTPLIRSPTGHKNLAVLTRWQYKRGSLNKKMTDGAFVRARIKWLY